MKAEAEAARAEAGTGAGAAKAKAKVLAAMGTRSPVHVIVLFTGSFRFDIEETPCEMKSVGETPLDNTHFLIF